MSSVTSGRRTSGRGAVVAGVAVSAVVIVLAILAYAAASPPIITDSDFAVTELYTELAARGSLTLGPYSRFGWNHPGPIYFYFQAPLYALGGGNAATLYAGAVAINLAALLTILWVTARQTRGPLLILLPALCLLLAWRLPRLLASPWTAHVPVLPGLAFVVLSAAVANGRLGLLPLTVVFGTFIAQTHLALVPLVVGITAGLIVVAVLRSHTGHGAPRGVLVATVAVGMVLWSLPILEAVSNGGGNLAALWQFFVASPASGQTAGQAVVGWSYGLTGVMRPDFELPWGGRMALSQPRWVLPCAFGQMALLGLAAIRNRAAGRSFEAWMAAVLLVASCIGLWAMTRIQGEILNHETFWLSAIGAANCAVIAAAGLRELAAFRRSQRLERPERTETSERNSWMQGPGHVSTGLLLVGLSAALGVSHLLDLTAFERRRTERTVLVAAHEAIRDYSRRERVSRLRVHVDDQVFTEAAGILLRLHQEDIPFGLATASAALMPRAFPVTGAEDVEIHISGLERHRALRQRPSSVILLSSNPIFIDARRITGAAGE